MHSASSLLSIQPSRHGAVDPKLVRKEGELTNSDTFEVGQLLEVWAEALGGVADVRLFMASRGMLERALRERRPS